MNTMMQLDDKTLQTPFGILGAVRSFERYPSGELKSAILGDENVILTHAGELTPYYTETPRRKYKPSVEFFKSGLVKAVSLEEQQEVRTPIGELPAELITFYESGELCRVFPLDGKVTGYWTEADEAEENIPLTFDLGFVQFTAKLSAICFYPSGDIKSITLFPGETITVGEVNVRHGLALYESGALSSLEPATPTMVPTPIGTLTAFDSEAIGVHADENSLHFYEDGSIKSLKTMTNTITVTCGDGSKKTYTQEPIPGLPEEETAFLPLTVHFHENGVSFNREEVHYPYDTIKFHIKGKKLTCLGSCHGCSGCG